MLAVLFSRVFVNLCGGTSPALTSKSIINPPKRVFKPSVRTSAERQEQLHHDGLHWRARNHAPRSSHLFGVCLTLVFAIDAIFPPLTGIGRYAFELARRLPQVHAMGELKFLSMWGWGQSLNDLSDKGLSSQTLMVREAFGRTRRWLAAKPWAIGPYDAVSDRWRGHLLRSARGAVYHSPNFFLSPHDGPSVATVHDLSVTRYPETHPEARRRYFELAFERSLSRATKLITVSETVRQELMADYGVPADRVQAVLNGVDSVFRPMTEVDTLPALRARGLRHGGYTLSVATVEPRKKLDKLITAYAKLPAPLRQAYPLVLIGSLGWLSSPVQRLIEQASSQGWLRFLGYVSQVELPVLYSGARGYAMTSIYEGFGLPVLEAMASGIPVLTSSVSCMPEVADGAALLAYPDDIDQLTDQLTRLLTDDEWRLQAVPRGLARARELSWERCLEQTVQVYRSVA